MSDTGKANDLLAQIPRGEKKGLPPVHLWNPPFCGDIDMRIARDGTWFYLGTPIGRKPMVKLFSSIIRRDGDDYFLVTPVEKVGIRVDDAPFVAVTLQVQGEGGAQVLRFATNVEDEVEADAGHPLRVEIAPPQPGTHALPAGARQPRGAGASQRVLPAGRAGGAAPDRRHRMARRLEPRRVLSPRPAAGLTGAA